MSDRRSGQMDQAFVTQAAAVLGDTTKGLSGPEIVELTSAYATDYDVQIPNAFYPFSNPISNKRTALRQNLMAFSDIQRYEVIRKLCQVLLDRGSNTEDVTKLVILLNQRYGHLRGDESEDIAFSAVTTDTKHWLESHPHVLSKYDEAIKKHGLGIMQRNVLDDLRLALETLLKEIFANGKSLEHQIDSIGALIASKSGSKEFVNMFQKLVEYYAKYQNTYVKHNDAVIEDEIEFVIEMTSSFMKHLVKLSNMP